MQPQEKKPYILLQLACTETRYDSKNQPTYLSWSSVVAEASIADKAERVSKRIPQGQCPGKAQRPDGYCLRNTSVKTLRPIVKA